MNYRTKEELLDFITEIENLAYAVSSIIGTTTLANLVTKAEALKSALRSDETILN